MRFEIGNDLRELRDQILDEGPRLRRLLGDELSFTFLRNFQDRVDSICHRWLIFL